MSQAPLTIDNVTHAAYRAADNNRAAALASFQAGNAAPENPVAGMFWLDTSTTPATLKQRNVANNAWGPPLLQFAVAGTVNTDTTLPMTKAVTKAMIDSAVAAIPSSGPTLLGTITTASGASQSLTGLDLTSYKFLRLVINGVSLSAAAKFRFNGVTIVDFGTGGEAAYGIIDIDLSTGVFGAMTGRGVPGTNPSAGGLSGVTNSSTLVTFTVSSGSFDAGSIKVYGIK